MKKIVMLMIFMILMTGVFATTIYIPEDYATIQAGINASEDGDEIIVSPGTYVENINFNGKAVILGSLFYTTQDTSYISQTIIDGNQNGSVVTFESEEGSTSVLTGFTITNGLTDGWGGGIYCISSSPSLANVMITGNSADDGGGISCTSSNPSLENVKITGNSAGSGGGIFFISSSPSLKNVTITDNSAEIFGGGIYFTSSSPSLANVTITDNSASYGGGIFCFSSSPSLVNCISWNNSPQEVEFWYYYDPNTITIANSDIDGGEEGIVINNNGTINWLEGNIAADPLFVDAEMEDYHLTGDSPCIDTGIAYFEYEGEVLVDLSEDEYWGIAPDMGAFEYVNLDSDENEITSSGIQLVNYPNPFNPETNIIYNLPEAAQTKIAVYNLKGQLVKLLADEILPAGNNSLLWNGRNENGKKVSSGVYLVRLNSSNEIATKKIMLMK